MSATIKKKSTKKKKSVTAIKPRWSFRTLFIKNRSVSTWPSYLRFSADVFGALRANRGVFFRLVLLGWAVTLLIVGAAQQTNYSELSDTTTILTDGVATGLSRASLEVSALFVSVLSGSLSGTLSEGQVIYIGAAYIMLWLVTVWLLRHQFTGTRVTLRDGLYNAAAPLLSTLLIVMVGVIQLLPIALGVSLTASALAAGGIVTGVSAIAIGLVMILLLVGTLYWLTGTLFAAIIVTIPGTYPWAALRSARQLIKGQRLQVLLRVLWLILTGFIAFGVALVPFLIIDNMFSLSSVYFVALALQLVLVVLTVYASTYIYMMYRRIIDEQR